MSYRSREERADEPLVGSRNTTGLNGRLDVEECPKQRELAAVFMQSWSHFVSEASELCVECIVGVLSRKAMPGNWPSDQHPRQ